MSPRDPQATRALQERRDETVRLLSEHFAQDILTIDELEERIERAEAAESLQELEELLADLSTTAPAGAATAATGDREGTPAEQAVARTAGLPAPRAVSLSDESQALVPRPARERRIVAVFSKSEGAGPEDSRVTAVMGESILDYRDVPLPPGVTAVRVAAVMGSVEIIVPPELNVECQGTAIMGEFQQLHRVPAEPAPEEPLLRVSGWVCMGACNISTRLPGETAPEARQRRKLEQKERRLRQRLEAPAGPRRKRLR